MKNPQSQPLNPDEVMSPSFWRAGTRQELQQKADELNMGDNIHIKTGVRALERLDNMVRKIEEVRKANLEDLKFSTMTELGAKVTNYEYGQKKLKEMYQITASVEGKIKDVVRSIDAEINQEIGNNAARARYGDETRKYVRSLPEDERVSFIRSQINDESWDVVEELLGTDRPFLIGISQQALTDLRSMYKSKRYADKIKRKELLYKLSEDIARGYQAVEKENIKVLESPEVLKAIKKRDRDHQLMGK